MDTICIKYVGTQGFRHDVWSSAFTINNVNTHAHFDGCINLLCYFPSCAFLLSYQKDPLITMFVYCVAFYERETHICRRSISILENEKILCAPLKAYTYQPGLYFLQEKKRVSCLINIRLVQVSPHYKQDSCRISCRTRIFYMKHKKNIIWCILPEP